MRGEQGPARRGQLTLLGGVLMAILVIVSFIFDPEGQSEFSRTLRQANERADAPQAAQRTEDKQKLIHAKSGPAAAGAAAPFDYYVLSLSWSPSFCEKRPKSDQCGKGLGFVTHGLWPQYERGYPQNCYTEQNRRVPGRLLRAYSDLAPSQGLLAHQWRKHGSCTGMTAEQYFKTARAARRSVAIPASLSKTAKSKRVDPRVVETAFMQANPGLDREEVTITCNSGDLAEVRVCLTRDLKPRRCGPDVIRDCSQRLVDLPAPR